MKMNRKGYYMELRNKILNAISKNSKITNEDLAVMLGIKKEVIDAEITAMEQEKII